MVGGQAVIEGVMMRGPGLTATAVRDPGRKIQVDTKPVHSISDRYPILKKPMLRGGQKAPRLLGPAAATRARRPRLWTSARALV